MLRHWAGEYDHLREVTETDVYTAFQDLRGHRRGNTLAALRSLFRFAKRRGLVFANPTRRIKRVHPDPAMRPMTDQEIRTIERVATRPAQRLVIALDAEHATRTDTIRHLRLGDVDLPGRRITLAGHHQRLGDELEQPPAP